MTVSPTTQLEQSREQYLNKPLPSSEDSERVLLGSVLLDNAVMPQIAERVAAEDLYSPLNRTVYAAMLKLFEKGSNIDPILICEEIKLMGGMIESFGGITTITNLSYGLPHFSEVDEYIKIVTDKALTRRLIRTYNQLTTEALAEEMPIEQLIDEAERKIFDVCEQPTLAKPELFSTLAFNAVTTKVQMVNDGIKVIGVPSGLADLDDKTGGWRKTDLIIIAGRPSMGKTALATQCAVFAAAKDPEMVIVVFSLEMSKEQLIDRILCSEAKVNLFKYRNNPQWLHQSEWERIEAARQRLSNSRLIIDDEPAISPMKMMAKSRRIFAEYKRLDLVVVDYLGLMNSSSRTESRVQEVSQISRELKAVAKNLNVPVIALSQMSRASETRNPPKPIMSDLRDSGSIEQDADVVLFVYRDEYYKKTEENAGIAELILAKQRNGPTGDVKTAFMGEYTRFENYWPEGDSRRS